MKNILITGGPVHAYLDDVKVITNKFKGGLMLKLAKEMNSQENVNVTYLTSELTPVDNSFPNIIYHSGFNDYMNKVLELAPKMDAVILGAAVANLIPKDPINGKFPSHNYNVGDEIPITFTIAPRIIDIVKKIAPKTHLFGFKLLSNVDYEELIDAAYGVLLESKATAIFANDTSNLKRKYAVTKERAVHPMELEDMVPWIMDILNDEYYSTVNKSIGNDKIADIPFMTVYNKSCNELKKLINEYENEFVRCGDYVFGCVAMRFKTNSNSFVTTVRGKNELKDFVLVEDVDHESRIVTVFGKNKASLNAPLLHYLFKNNPECDIILHFHKCDKSLDTLPYAPPGTVRDSIRDCNTSFNIKNHGVIRMFKNVWCNRI